MIQFPERHPWWVRYGVAVLAALLGLSLTWALVLGGLRIHSAFMLTAVLVAAWFGGSRPGMLTLLLMMPGQVLLRDPVNSWRIEGKNEWAGFLIYMLNALVICALFGKRYYQRSRTEVSPVAVTGGWMWELDPQDGGTVHTRSPEFPSLCTTRTLALWLETVHPADREEVQRQIQQALLGDRLAVQYRVLRDKGEVRLVSMFGVKVRESESHDALVATCMEMGVRANPERLEWSALPLG